MLIILLLAVSSAGCGGSADNLTSTVLPQTDQVRMLSKFPFSISPDNRWMLFYQQVPEEELMTVHDDARLRILDLQSGDLYRFTMPKNTGPIDSSLVSTARWTADGAFYVGARFAIVIGEDQVPDLVMDLRHERNAVQIGDRLIPHKDVAYCSDCYDGLTDGKVIEAIIGSELAKENRTNSEQIVSPDADKVYYQKGRHTSTVHLHERSRQTGEDRRLSTHRGQCAGAMYLRLSPDGRYLAYQISTGCQWVNPAQLYIVDVKEKKHWRVGADVFQDVFYMMHWTSDSTRLYYGGRDRNRVTYVAYVDVPQVGTADADDEHVKQDATSPEVTPE